MGIINYGSNFLNFFNYQMSMIHLIYVSSVHVFQYLIFFNLTVYAVVGNIVERELDSSGKGRTGGKRGRGGQEA